MNSAISYKANEIRRLSWLSKVENGKMILKNCGNEGEESDPEGE